MMYISSFPAPVYSSIIIERYIGIDGTQNDVFIFKFFHERYDTIRRKRYTTFFNNNNNNNNFWLAYRSSFRDRISQITIEN